MTSSPVSAPMRGSSAQANSVAVRDKHSVRGGRVPLTEINAPRPATAVSRFRTLTVATLVIGFSLSFAGKAAQTGGLDQEQAAQAAMEKSLAQQQAAIDSFRNGLDAGSLKEQQESVKQQAVAVEGQAPPPDSPVAPPTQNTPVATANETANAQSPATRAVNSQGAESRFFTFDWPSSIPLAVPNVQMPEAEYACDPLGDSEVNKLVQDASKKNDVNPNLLKSVMRQESAFKPCAYSVAGAMGLMQIMPETADMLGLDDPYNPAKNVDAGAKFLKMMLDRYQGNVPMALGAYNAGPGTVDKAGGIPPIAETVQYISNVLGALPFAY